MIDGMGLTPPERLLTPAYRPLRMNRQPPRYVPTPLPEGMARVVLDEDYYTGPGWCDYQGSPHHPDDVFDIPVEQHERWQAAEDAYSAMQAEIADLIEQRREPSRPRLMQHGPAPAAARQRA